MVAFIRKYVIIAMPMNQSAGHEKVRLRKFCTY